MQSSLLLTKLGSPPPARHLVQRARLFDALDRGVPDASLTLVLAPAGYGKTTLLAAWADQTPLPVAWLTIDPGDNDPERLLRYLFAAWATVQPDIENAPPGVLLSGMMPDPDRVLAELVNHATQTGIEMALVLDDCHLIENQEIFDAIAYLLDHLPPTIHLILAGRTDPSLPLARYRARQDVLDIGIDELRFTDDETRLLLNGRMGLDIPDGDIVPLHDRLEGWPAGLQLASLTLRNRLTAIPDIAITGRNRFIGDFLRDEVLAVLPTETRRFLLRTSIVDRLCGSLGDAITGASTSQATLEQLERDHLFTIPLDDSREWFRYHRLLADYLRAEVERELPGEVAELHRRAGRWHLEHDLPESAFDHAIAAGDLDLVTQVLERHWRLRLFSGQIANLLRWDAAIPSAWIEAEPMLGIFRSALLFATGQLDACSRCLDEVERAIRCADRELPDAQARVTAVRCFMACATNDLELAESLADLALETLAPTDESFRGDVYSALGDTYRRNGRWAQAHANYLRAIDRSDDPGTRIQSVHAFGALADLALRQGGLHQAAGYWRRALALIDDQRLRGAYPLPVIGWVHIRLGEILYEWNDLDAAQEHLDQGRERAELGGDPRSIIAGGILADRIMLARGEIASAEEALEQVRPAIEDAQFPEWSGQFDRCQLRLWLAQDTLGSAVAWSETMLASDDALARPEHEHTELAIAQVLLITGTAESSDRALALLDHIADSARAEGRTGMQIEALALRSLARWARGDRANALTSLEHALRLAEPEGYVRTFVDAGLPMARFLQDARARHVMPAYVEKLLAGFGDALPSGQASSHLPEPLSPRELEVLRNLAAGLTNREIAGSLFISPETVKKHTGSIYGKLGVRSRMEAVAVSRELHLLD